MLAIAPQTRENGVTVLVEKLNPPLYAKVRLQPEAAIGIAQRMRCRPGFLLTEFAAAGGRGRG